MIRIALAQQDFPVGDMTGNLDRVLQNISSSLAKGADLILFPEMAISGYPPEDLLLRPGFMHRCHAVMDQLVSSVQGIDVVIGHPWAVADERFNTVSWIRDGVVLGRYFKQVLPNYAVFDEHRYFSAGSQSLVIDIKGSRVGVIICEDAWVQGPASMAKTTGAQLLLVANASPYYANKLSERINIMLERGKDCGLPMVYGNLVGGQDELVFDGRSMLMNAGGGFSIRATVCENSLPVACFEPESGQLWFEDKQDNNNLDADTLRSGEDITACIYTVLVRGLKDYVVKNSFTDVTLGLSGGIDSALTLALAVDALGADHVHAVMMPSRHTSDLSLKLARQQADMLEVAYREISIEQAFEALLDSLEVSFEGCRADVTEENLQARVRANMLMALSNKFGWLVLATGNKSELAVGYSTIYGDMCGGFSPIKDCFKTRVYELSTYRNTISAAIPQAVIDRPPSAELAPGQLDQDSLPEYDLLDQILYHYIEQDWSIADIVSAGFDETVVRRVAAMVIRNEYKRRQGAPGVRITSRAFGRDRRYPITSGWHEESIKKPE
jgi:NAD+ synthase (glutamine-hydrolysing)